MKVTVVNTSFILSFLMVSQAFGQQSGTTTECEKSPIDQNQMTCKTTATPPPWYETGIFAPKKRTDQAQTQSVVAAAPGGLSPEAVKAYFAEMQARQDAKDVVDYIYCRQNPKGSVTSDDDKQKTCYEVIEYTKAFCSVNPNKGRCNLAHSRAEVQKAFDALVTEYHADPHRNDKNQAYFNEKFTKYIQWGCMSFPDMVLPQKEGTHACPSAPDAGSQNK